MNKHPFFVKIFRKKKYNFYDLEIYNSNVCFMIQHNEIKPLLCVIED